MTDEADPASVGAEPDDWESEPPPRRAPSTPTLHLEGYDGPADLLLDLAQRRRIDLGVMSVLALAQQFADAVDRLAGTVPIEQRAEWLVMAAQLVLLRARLLFPATAAEEVAAERDAAAELRRLDAMVFMRAAAVWLQDRPQLGADVFARPPAETPKREVGYVALMEAALAALRGREGRPGEAEPVYRVAVAELWRVPDAMARIRAVLEERPEGGELAYFLPVIGAGEVDGALKMRAAVASTFVAGLELAKDGIVEVSQAAVFALIQLRALAHGLEPTLEQDTTPEAALPPG